MIGEKAARVSFARTHFVVLLAGLAFLIIGFGPESPAAFPAPAQNQKPAVQVISNPKTPVPPPGARKRLVFSEELSIGQKEGDENTLFGDDVVFNTDEEGNFYVTDWDKKRILKFAPSGKYLLTIGREGQGPGEFQNLSVARFDSKGDMYVTDIASRRISFFDKTGKYLRQIRIPDVFEDLYINSKGRYISSHSVQLNSDTGMTWRIDDGIYDDKFNLLTEFRSQVWDPRPPADRSATAVAKFTAGILSGMAFQPRSRHILAADDSIHFGHTADYAIDVYSPEGLKLKTIQREYDPVPVTEKDKEYFEAQAARPFLSRGGISRGEEQIREILKFIEYPKFKPAFQSFGLMENGWLIVLADFTPGESWLFDLFDKAGRYIGQFKAHFPADYSFFFKNGKAYAVETDKDGYKFVKRYGFKIEDY
jgi:hypothetical protein